MQEASEKNGERQEKNGSAATNQPTNQPTNQSINQMNYILLKMKI